MLLCQENYELHIKVHFQGKHGENELKSRQFFLNDACSDVLTGRSLITTTNVTTKFPRFI